ncbi:putative recombinase [Streptosporangium pseudovulgare]|uniref:Recombinase n=1 Tax=Streptosporangium pseudovulgare TaxID=35765 RepID=A0ABQ2QUW5_9ACTN|nr:putative recombinase [Streptosporangium pseudovulgare]
MRFAFYGRVSTEDNQDPESSRAWQITRSRALIEARGGEIVAEFFDVDKSRSIPWQRRPRAAALLAELRDPGRGFEAVVIGEPHRAFYGNQYGLTFPIFEHFGVPLWVPEVGGPIDPANEAHDLVMSVFGGMSKGERNRVKIRVRSAMSAQAQMEGRFLGGRPPYGYRLGDAGPHPNPAKAADGRRLHRLELDPVAAPVVARIFAEFLNGHGLFAIAEGLTRDGVPSPSAHDPGRNRHRVGIAWSKGAVRAILTNPRYTGHQVWNRQRKDEVLLDVDDVGLGHTTKLRWNSREEWVWSDDVAHAPIVSPEDFTAAQDTLAGRGGRRSGRRTRRTSNPYLLRGLLFCGVCERRMQGNWVNEAPYYRCRFPEEYALANRVVHPRNVYLREDVLVPRLDRWLGRLFAPHRVEETLNALVAAQLVEAPEGEALAVARRQIAESDRRLAQHRAALEAGADPAVVAGWIREEQARKAEAEARLRRVPLRRRRLDRDDLAAMMRTLGDMVRVLGEAEPARKARIYGGLNLRLTYHPGKRKVLVSSGADQHLIGESNVSEGGLEPPCPAKGTSTSS